MREFCVSFFLKCFFVDQDRFVKCITARAIELGIYSKDSNADVDRFLEVRKESFRILRRIPRNG